VVLGATAGEAHLVRVATATEPAGSCKSTEQPRLTPA
jgi:hypothetical protein